MTPQTQAQPGTATGKALPDPKDLSRTLRQALDTVRRRSLFRVRGGYRNGSTVISLKTVERLEALRLIRAVVENGRRTIVCTGSGLDVLRIIEQREGDRQGGEA